MGDPRCSFISHNRYFYIYTRYEGVFILRRDLVAMCSGAQIIAGVLRKELPQNMTRAQTIRTRPKLKCGSLVCNLSFYLKLLFYLLIYPACFLVLD